MMSAVTLESVYLSFQQWRSQRSSRTEPIPENLWTMALSLYPEYKRSHICRRLGISGGQFKQRLEEVSSDFSDVGFVLASSGIDEQPQKPIPEIVLGIQGHQRTLTVRVNIDSLSEVLPHIEALL